MVKPERNAQSGTGPLRLWRRLVALFVFPLALIAGGLGLLAQDLVAPGQERTAIVLEIDGAIGPATSHFITTNLERAAERGVALVVLRMDTPGGLDNSMRSIIRAILASPVPVATYVAPSGARAASAGTYILYASHVAAMAPATNLGAATPVTIGGGGDDAPGDMPFSLQLGDDAAQPDADAQPANGQQAQDPATDPAPVTGEDENATDAPDTETDRPLSASEAKMINDAVAYIRGLAELRDRNADWAERAVREAVSLTAREAAVINVIDFVAADLQELLVQANGMIVTTPLGEVTLDTDALAIEIVEPDFRTAFLSIITNPNVALILMLVGVYGLIFEFLNPGALVPGTIGAISLLLGLYSLAMLPLNYTGALLILLGLALVLAEAFAPSFGILGIGGTAALVLGMVILVDTDVPGLAISLPLIGGVAVAGTILTLIVARLAAKSWRRRVVSGREELIGATGRVLDWQDRAGHVWLSSERWNAQGPAGLQVDDTVRVVGISGLVLMVEPLRGTHAAAAPA